MNFFTRLMVSVTGHHIEPNSKIQDVAGLSKIGLSICFASALAALQFGVAGWFLSSGLEPPLQSIAAVVMALIGACVVLIIDRNFIYAADTAYQTSGYMAYVYLAIRVFLILVISSLSSQFTLPLLLKSELEIHVQDLRDERYDLAKNRYTNKHELTEKIREERDLNQKIVKLKTSLQNLPPDLVHKKLAAEQCLKEYRKKVNSSIGPDVDDEEVANLYVHEKIRCERLELAYKEEYKVYIAPRQAELTINESAYRRQENELRQAQSLFKEDLQKANSNNANYLNTSSADVLWSLIDNNPGARMKYLMITMVQLILELMPLLLKSLLGRSPLGLAIALKQQMFHEEFMNVQHQYALEKIKRSVEFKKLSYEDSELEMNSKIAIQHLENQLRDLKNESQLWLSGLLSKSKHRMVKKELSASRNDDQTSSSAKNDATNQSQISPNSYVTS